MEERVFILKMTSDNVCIIVIAVIFSSADAPAYNNNQFVYCHLRLIGHFIAGN